MLLHVGASAEQDITAPGFGLEALMRQMSSVARSEALFVERKDFALLTAPLVSSGRLSYAAPDRLRKETTAPKRALLAVSGDVLTVARDTDSARELRLSEYPEIEALVSGVRATLAGDLAGLRRFYRVGFEGQALSWRLTLVPLSGRVREMVDAVVISGEGRAIARIETHEAGGDLSVMTITALP